MQTFIVQFFNADDELVGEESIQTRCIENAEDWAEERKEEFGALYYNVN